MNDLLIVNISELLNFRSWSWTACKTPLLSRALRSPNQNSKQIFISFVESPTSLCLQVVALKLYCIVRRIVHCIVMMFVHHCYVKIRFRPFRVHLKTLILIFIVTPVYKHQQYNPSNNTI